MNTATGWISASAGSSAATKSLVATIKAATMSAATEGEKSAAKAAPVVGNAIAQGVQSLNDAAAALKTPRVCATGASCGN
jgi:hypothetical protein